MQSADRNQQVGLVLYLRMAVVAALLTTAAVREALRISAFSTDEIWWHLSTGRWTLHHLTAPHTGLFSQLSTSPWIDFSWFYDALFGAIYAGLGLRSLPLMLMIFKVALAAVTLLLAGVRRNGFWTAVTLSTLAQLALYNLQPLPVMFSICFFGLSCYLLLEAHRQNQIKFLFWLPLLFWVWANLDAQFVLGLLLLCVFLIAETLERTLFGTASRSRDSKPIPLVHLCAISAACLFATFITPYSFRLIPAAIQDSYSSVLFKNFAFMAAMEFRQPEHFLLLSLVLAACMALGRERSRDLFRIFLLALCAALAFRIQRDSWTIVLSSIAVLSGSVGPRSGEGLQPAPPVPFRKFVSLATIVAAVLLFSFFLLPSNSELHSRLSRVTPAAACDYIRSNQLPGPIFNEYQWGGYLTMNLPEYPVSIDQRMNLYGEQASGAYFDVIMGRQRMETFPAFAGAQTILLPKGLAITRALTTIPALQQQFREVYSDDLAVVLVRR